ncbi:MAG: hypothetical protein IJE97_00820, partial [Thermoguttaceae bacterium]|nr:hypothetical protein [Thermoguttaceae bacterium]
DVARGKLDAYFFYEALQASGLERAPEFLVFIDELYDPTHILRDLSANLQFKPIPIHKNLKTETKLTQLLKGVLKRDA